MGKIEVEVEDEDIKFLKGALKVDLQVLVQELTNVIVKGLKELQLAHQAGVPITAEGLHKLGEETGKQVMKKATEAAEEEAETDD